MLDHVLVSADIISLLIKGVTLISGAVIWASTCINSESVLLLSLFLPLSLSSLSLPLSLCTAGKNLYNNEHVAIKLVSTLDLCTPLMHRTVLTLSSSQSKIKGNYPLGLSTFIVRVLPLSYLKVYSGSGWLREFKLHRTKALKFKQLYLREHLTC